MILIARHGRVMSGTKHEWTFEMNTDEETAKLLTFEQGGETYRGSLDSVPGDVIYDFEEMGYEVTEL